MKNWLLVIVFVFVISCKEKQPLSIDERFEIEYHNFIPNSVPEAPNYWSTWGAQNYASDINIAKKAADGNNNTYEITKQVNEENIFGAKEWSSYFPKVTKDLYILFDLGWNINNSKQKDDPWQYGSFEVSENKFPTCKGTAVERLTKLNDLCKDAGWKGAGLRLSANPGIAAYSVDYQLEIIKRYYYEKILMCSAAGIKYLKIDDGLYSDNADFRKMITSAAREAAPDLIIEHTQNINPINDYNSPTDSIISHETGTFKEWGNGSVLAKSVETVSFSDVFQIQDVTEQLAIATTLERVSQILSQITEPTITKGIINCGDELFLAAGLGCSMGIERHALFIESPELTYDPFSKKKRIDEVFRAIRWQRVAQPFGAGQSMVYIDAKRLTDSWIFRKGDSRATWLIGDTIIQKAPARISRGMALPEVESKGEPCYVVSSKYPNGAIAVATLPRVSADSGLYYPLVDIKIKAENWKNPIAIFGEVKSVTITFDKLPKNPVIWGQDLSASRAVPIADLIEVNENSIKLSGDLIRKIGLLAATPDDISYPAMMIKIEK